MLRSIVLFVICSIALAENELTTGVSNFASDFYQECAKSTTGNVIISPFSVANVLALLSQAADGNTFEQIRSELQLNGDKPTAANQFHEYYGLLERGAGNTTFSVANQVYVQQGYPLNQYLQQVAVQKFSSGIESINFAHRAEAAQTINQFVEQKTKGKITNLIKPATLNADARVVLINAVYFKGDWKYKFNKQFTVKADFYTSETESVSVDFMHIEGTYNYGELPELDASALEMKYADSNYSMVLILPNSHAGLSTLETKLKGHDFTKITTEMRSQKVKVDIPKFKVEFEIKLNDVLKNLGMVDMFSGAADLSGLLQAKEPLVVSDAVHKAFIEVNEEGSEAAAATGLMITKRIGGMPRAEFYCDHPFIYYIWDHNSRTTVFIGRITNFN
ncbi:serine protease inhibitor 42Dd-like [Sitodiplosis mosellana]|uniref:serine protease inhibitor 42Dd-like n=1 Tax=Sitodiplosis mosellana TaxID=263140 RepID=UPI0024446E2D|nr:serine protease inhibitor 42Dd-like [Sitodiplosis mosellana]